MLDEKRIQELRTMPYEDYLQTPEWQAKREIALRIAEYRCQTCNSPDNLHVHHRTYERRGQELLADLTVLCKLCHESFHEQRKLHEEQEISIDKLQEECYTWLGKYRHWSDIILREKTFDNFDGGRQPHAYEVAKLFALDPDGTLVLHGTYGTGKTHLLAAVCNAALVNKKPVRSLFTTSPKLFAAIQECIGRGEEYAWLIEKAIAISLLVIDDIDKAKWSAFREEIYFSIMDERVKAGKPTAISTNRLDELADFVGGAVCSRLKVRQVEAEMVGDDYREEV